ncbi:nucleotidyl transferase AbiEii/AbiGii toxin family protein [bacterium]|nr:nucleotidyl transferase AbiEii/AbiGii toxin family protein [bacterium]
MKLHENPKDFKDAIEATSKELDIREVFVEKDYWVCFILKNLSLSVYKGEAVFKGGTSLSKAHKLIHRFSEDVDLAVIVGERNDNQIKSLISKIEDALAKSPLKETHKEGVTSKRGRFRKTVWQYEQIIEGDFGNASSDLLLEINSFAKPNPFSEHKLQSYITDFFEAKGLQSEIEKYELQSFTVNVLDIERTFTEKIAAISRASFTDPDKHTDLIKKIRHLYDVSLLLRTDKIQKFVDSDDFLKLYEDVKTDDLRVTALHSEKNIADSPIFKKTEVVLKDIQAHYENDFMSLVYRKESAPSILEVQQALVKIKASFNKA